MASGAFFANKLFIGLVYQLPRRRSIQVSRTLTKLFGSRKGDFARTRLNETIAPLDVPLTDRMTICYIPGRESTYPRNATLVRLLKLRGFRVFDCSYARRVPYRFVISFLRFFRRLRQCDVVMVGFLGHFYVPFIRLFTAKPIVFDAYISLYQTLVAERRSFPERTLRSAVAWHIDRLACLLSDIVLLDTEAHIDYFAQTFSLPRSKFRVVASSCGEIRTSDGSQRSDHSFLIVHYSEFQELHGVEWIIRAADVLPDLRFRLIGDGRLRDDAIKLAKELRLSNVEFVPFLPYEELSEEMKHADLCLGIFGGTEKADMVVPNKVYDYLSLGRATVTQDSAAVRANFVPGRDLLTCAPRDSESLAAQIRKVADSAELKRSLGENGGAAFVSNFSDPILAAALGDAIDDVLLPASVSMKSK